MATTYRADWAEEDGTLRNKDFGGNEKSAKAFARRKSKGKGPDPFDALNGPIVYVIKTVDGVDVGQWPYYAGTSEGYESADVEAVA